ncbi:DMT family transporter [Pseudozobellia thermophila]|uniref:EamA domain-containing membrane protein RarD n=1 Tax=Pseudozobellia thermophila TaxID=192903 RepID=A0A1M6I8K8_9FLAO|nr:DMT family transporter [Pseudozobellia thermophila]SHJ30747.1 EamA domain-containing membrane protein RarD [Pseudozobellia thermophila]
MDPKLKNYLHLHFIVFIWGFTAVLGKLITQDALPLVWYRMLLATLFVFVFVAYKGYTLKVSKRMLAELVVAGVVIALHWLTFFGAIKASNVSVALATMSTGAFFTALIEPFWYKRKMVGYEIAFGLVVIFGLFLIFQVEGRYVQGVVLALVSALLSAVFSLMNGKLIQKGRPSVISFYELLGGLAFLSLYMGWKGGYVSQIFEVTWSDMLYIFILASICTAYAFIASVKLLKYISPYTVMLTINLEPVYGIVLAFFIFGESEKMGPMFYLGGAIIVSTVIANGIMKNRRRIKKGAIE